MKPSAAEEGEKLCEEPPEDKGKGDPAALSEVNEAEAGESPPDNPVDQLRTLKGLVEVQVEQLMKALMTPGVDAFTVRTISQNLMEAWSKYKDQFGRLCNVAMRRRDQDLQSDYDALRHRYNEAFEF